MNFRTKITLAGASTASLATPTCMSVTDGAETHMLLDNNIQASIT